MVVTRSLVLASLLFLGSNCSENLESSGKGKLHNTKKDQSWARSHLDQVLYFNLDHQIRSLYWRWSTVDKWSDHTKELFLSIFNLGGYIRVTSGSTCERVTSKTECEEAARQLGLSDTVASEETKSNWPPYCYLNINALYFNINGNTTSHCNSNSRICICKETPGNILQLLLQSFLPVQVDLTEHV